MPKRLIFIYIILFSILSFNAFSGSLIKLEAIFFDMDGVLVDTEYLKYEAWHQSLKDKLQIDFTLDEYIPLVGASSEEILSKILSKHKILLNDIETKSLLALKTNIYKKRQQHGVNPIVPAVKFFKELIKLKSTNNIKLGVVSSAGHSEIRANLKQIGVNPNELDAVASGDDDLKDIKDPTGTNKPKPYIYQKIARVLNVDPQKCVVFEDTSAGVQAAYNANMKVYAVPNKFTLQHDFSKSVKIINFKDLPGSSAKELLKNGKITSIKRVHR